MTSLTNFALNEEYHSIQRFGDRLTDLESMINRGEKFCFITGDVYSNPTDQDSDKTWMRSCC